MKENIRFIKRMNSILEDVDPSVFSYDESEFWMVQSPYEYIEFYAIQNKLQNTYIALKLARGLHDGGHRKLSVLKDGAYYRLPYLIHPLLVTRMLVDIHVPLPHDEEDILLAASLCHDMIEDIGFEDGGKELYKLYHLDPRVYETVRYVSKRYDFTEEDEKQFFHNIETHELALMIKLSDRGNNVEDLYNMSFSKVHEYIGETKKFFIPMCDYALEHYHDRVHSFVILKDKIVLLTSVAQILVDRYAEKQKVLQNEIDELRNENERLRKEWKELWED